MEYKSREVISRVELVGRCDEVFTLCWWRQWLSCTYKRLRRVMTWAQLLQQHQSSSHSLQLHTSHCNRNTSHLFNYLTCPVVSHVCNCQLVPVVVKELKVIQCSSAPRIQDTANTVVQAVIMWRPAGRTAMWARWQINPCSKTKSDWPIVVVGSRSEFISLCIPTSLYV